MKRNNQGFTLIEVMLAMAVLSFMFLPLMKYFSDSEKINRQARDRQNASYLAESLLEEVRLATVAEELESILVGEGFSKTSVVNVGESDGYHVKYTGDVVQGDSTYTAVLDVSFTAPEVAAYNSSAANTVTEAELFPFNALTDIQAIEGTQKEEALYYFERENLSYCQQMAALDPPVEVAPCSREELEQYMERVMNLKITEDSVTVFYSYTCVAPGCSAYGPEKGGSYLYQGLRKEDWKNLYLFYEPMGNKADTLNIQVTGEAVPLDRLHLICQTDRSAAPTITILGGNQIKEGAVIYSNAGTVITSGKLEWYQPVPGEGAGYSLISQKEARRIAQVIVSVYGKQPEPLVTLETRKGE